MTACLHPNSGVTYRGESPPQFPCLAPTFQAAAVSPTPSPALRLPQAAAKRFPCQPRWLRHSKEKKEHSSRLLGKLRSLGSSEKWPVMFSGNKGLSPYPVLHLSCPDSSSATSHRCSRAHTQHRRSYPCSLVPVCLHTLAEAEQTIATAVQQLFCTLLRLQLARGAAHRAAPGTTGHKNRPWRAEEAQACRCNPGKGVPALTRWTRNLPTTSLFPKQTER